MADRSASGQDRVKEYVN